MISGSCAAMRVRQRALSCVDTMFHIACTMRRSLGLSAAVRRMAPATQCVPTSAAHKAACVARHASSLRTPDAAMLASPAPRAVAPQHRSFGAVSASSGAMGGHGYGGYGNGHHLGHVRATCCACSVRVPCAHDMTRVRTTHTGVVDAPWWRYTTPPHHRLATGRYSARRSTGRPS